MKTQNRTGENCHPVAVIGMGCFFPKASGLKEYWRLLFKGQDAIGEVPETHWSPADYYHKDPKKPDHVYCKRGGYLSPISFDPSEFGIPPSALEATDTSQLLGLLAARIALEDAGYGLDREFDRDRTGVILGATGTQELVIPLGARLGHPHWRRALEKAGISPEKAEEVMGYISDAYVPWQENSFPGLLGNVIAGRIANRLNLGGTNCAVDAACASSMAAMHMSLMEIWSGRAEMMVSGGVDCLNDIFMHMCFSKTPILSPTGDVRPFSANADGSLLGEGVGLLVFKSLDKAEADGDRIYAVIKGVGSSSDGKSGSIYAPRAEGQIKALRTAYAQAGFSPATVELVEAHGTGTRVGDEVEFRALKQVYAEAGLRGEKNRCAVGTVKSMIGHTKAAAGAAGLIKSVLALHHKVLPPTLKIDQPDPRLQITDSPFYLNTRTNPWISSPDHPRRCAVSSFGFGGSNFHMVLEEYQKQKSDPSWDGSVEILALSGASPAELETRLAELKTDMAQGMSDEEISRRAAKTRAEFSMSRPYRILVVLEKALDRFENLTETFSAAIEQIKSGAGEKARNIRNIFYGGPEHPGKMAFVFPGQGSQYTEMGRDLVSCFPQALETMEKADAKTHLPDKLSSYIYPAPPMNPEEKTEQETRLRSTDAAQPAIGAVSLSMIKILKYFGINPDAACGHSFGELCALHAAGRIDEETLMELAAERGRVMAEAGKANAGTMTAVQAPLADIEKIIREECPEVILANRNSPDQGVVSGSVSAIEKAERVFAKHGISFKRLPVFAAFHSPLMKDAQKAFAAAISRIMMKPSDIPVFSNASAQPYPDNSEAAKTLLAGQILSPVDFVNEIRNLFQIGVRTFVEVGPKSVLTGLLRAILKGLQFNSLSLDASGGRGFGISDLARVLCYLAALGHPVNLKNWEQPLPETRRQRMSVPISGANYRSSNKNKADEKKIPPARGMGNAQSVQTGAPHPDGKTRPAVNASVSGKAEIPSVSLMSADQMGKQQALPEKKPPVRSIPPRSDNHTKMVREIKPMNKTNPPSASGQARHSLMSDAFKAVQEGLKSIQNLHFQTAETHKKFLEAQTRAGRTLQEMMENTRRLAEISLGIPMPAFAESYVVPAYSSPNISGQERIYRPANAQPQAEKAAPLPYSSFSHPETQAKSAEPLPYSTRQAPAPAVSAPSQQISSQTAKPQSAVPEKTVAPAPKPAPKNDARQKIEKTMLEVVSELTGYPAEMLNLEMDIEADLGIDSIKRVEILSAFEEKMPDIPPVSPEIMGTLKTLGQIVDYLCKESVIPDQPEPAKEAPKSAVEASATPAKADRQKIESVMMAVVSDLTGYPAEMLNLDMDIEADLGIDSIKRVEILSAFEEKMPNLPPVSPEIMGTLKTLGQIVDYLCKAGSVSVAAHPVQEQSVPVFSQTSGTSVHRTSEISATQTSRASIKEIESVMMAVVSDLTGYPAEMLNLDMDIEADLGIDSIKRVEILSAFEEKMPNLPPVSPEIMGTLKTLGHIVEYLNKSGTVADVQTVAKTEISHVQPHPDLKTEVSHVTPHPDLKKKIVTLTPASALCEPVRIPADRPVYITQDRKGLAKAIADALQSQGAGAVLISPSQLPGKAEPPLPGGLIVLADAWEKQDSDFLKQVFALTQGFANDLLESAKQGGAIFATVSRMDGGFGFTGKSFENPYQGGLAGLSKTASMEWEKVCCHALDIAPQWTDTAEIAKAVVREILHHSPVEVGLNPNGRFTPELREAAYPQGKIRLQAKDAVIVTGGARGVTAAAALALAREFQPTLILVGRSPRPLTEPEWLGGLHTEAEMKKAILKHSFAGKNPRPAELESAFRKYRADREIISNLEQIRMTGATVAYFPADVRSANAVRAVVDQVRSSYGPIRALIHGAGILEDRLIADKTQEQFDRVFDTKVKGLEILLDALKDEPLKYLILFSSVAGRMGNQGQADYATANEVLNKTAWCQARKRPDCRVISFNWGPWDGGMVSPGLKKEFAKRNIDLIPMDAGVQSMLAEMCGTGNEAVEVVIGGMLAGETATVSVPSSPAPNPQPPIPSPQPLSGLKREIDLPRFPFLKDHMLDGRPVVPFAMMAEWLGHSALHENPGLFFHGLEDFRLLKGISLNNGASVPIRLISGKAKRNGALYSADVEIRGGENGETPMIHSKARAVLGDTPPSRSPAYSSRLDIHMKSYTRNMDEVYGKILFHGPELHGIQEIINCSPEGITADLCAAPHPEQWMTEPLRSQWLSDPLVLDCAFQMAIVWCYEEKGLFCLPVYAGSYRQFRPAFPADGLTAVLEVTETGQHRMKGDFVFLDRNEQMVARIQGYEAVMEKSLERAFFARQ
ncbi:MAG: SDR family NAD(P)-dependent oxidoreductase [Desulfococcaceae bacterium]